VSGRDLWSQQLASRCSNRQRADELTTREVGENHENTRTKVRSQARVDGQRNPLLAQCSCTGRERGSSIYSFGVGIASLIEAANRYRE
jgi:hypothetical protein